MRFRDDQRGVTVQIGAVLLFATIVVALAMYQATVVPAQNQGVEYRHSQQVQNQMTDVRNAILGTAASGNTRPTSVTLGTQYPSRVFLVNPPPATGTLATGSYANATIRLSNVNATNDETADFLDGSWNASTKYLSYRPDYYEYADAPNLVYGGTTLYNHYPEANASVPLTDQLLVRGDTITLLALNGSVDTSRVGSVSVSPTPVSAPYTEVQVEAVDDSEPVTVTVPTRLPASALENMTGLDDRATANVVDAGENRVTIRLNGSGPYTLRTAKLGVGSGVTDEGARYLTTDDGSVVSDGETFTVSVRDRFHNPVADADVLVSVDPDLVEDDDGDKSVPAPGRVTFTYDGPDTEFNASIPSIDGPEGNVTFEGRSTYTGNGTGIGSGAAYDVTWLSSESAAQNAALTCTDARCTLNANVNESVTLISASSPVVDGGTFRYGVQNTSVGTVSPDTDATDSRGKSVTEFTATGNGTTNVYVSGGGSGDLLSLAVIGVDGGGPTGQTRAYPDTYNDWDGSVGGSENNSIPPGTGARGTVSNFREIQSDQRTDQYEGFATFETNYPSGASAHRMNVGTATYNVSTTGSDYTLEVEYRFYNSNDAEPGEYEIHVVDASGNSLQSESITTIGTNPTTKQISLNSVAEQYVKKNGVVYVRYERGPGSYSQILIYSQQITVS